MSRRDGSQTIETYREFSKWLACITRPGGPEYTGLQSGRLEHIDMTHLLVLDRIILIGKGPSATEWLPQKKGESELKYFKDAGDTTLWRIVLELRN